MENNGEEYKSKKLRRAKPNSQFLFGLVQVEAEVLTLDKSKALEVSVWKRQPFHVNNHSKDKNDISLNFKIKTKQGTAVQSFK